MHSFSDQIHSQLAMISSFMRRYDNSLFTINGGLPGEILFYFYYYNLTKEEQYLDTAIEKLEKYYDVLEQEALESSLYSSGIAGIGWFLEHISRFVEIDNAFNDPEIDHILTENIRLTLKKRNYEFFYGSAGMLLYCLSRKNSADFKGVISEVIDYLYDHTVAVNDPHRFFMENDEEYQNASINLGVSHGIFGLVAVLTKAYQKEINVSKCKEIIYLMIELALNNQLDPKKYNCFFPNRIIYDKTVSVTGSKLSWCYGDLGILAVLLNTSKALKNNALEDETLRMLMYTSHRKNLEDNAVRDIWMCHGSSGIAHIFNRLYRTTAIDDFKFASRYWYQITLQNVSKGHFQISGSGTHSGAFERKDLTGFLLGHAGLGLSLISAIAPFDPQWDEMLLLS